MGAAAWSCSVLTGMDQLHEVDCVDPCDASMVLGVDATLADTQAPDVTVPDSQLDTTTTLSTDAGADGPSEGTDSGNAADGTHRSDV